MSDHIVTALLQNAGLLMALGVAYGCLPWRPRPGRIFTNISLGLVVGTIALAVMATPWELHDGVFFDSRSILLGVSGLFFGPSVTITAGVVAALYRICLGGTGTLTGVAVIVTCCGLGLAWGHLRRAPYGRYDWLELWVFGVTLHVTMLIWMLTLPGGIASDVLHQVALPVMVIFPTGTVLLGQLLSRQHGDFVEGTRVRARERRFRKMLEQGWDVIFLTDRDLVVTYASGAVGKVLLLNIEDVVGSRFDRLVHPEDRDAACELFASLASRPGHTQAMNGRIRCRADGWLWMELAVSNLLQDPDVQALVINSRDLSDAIAAEHERRNAEARLREQQKLESIATLAGGVAHEINNPITGIMGYAELLRDKYGNDDEDSALYTGEIIEETQRVAGIVRNLLHFAQSGTEGVIPAPMRQVAEAALSLMQTFLRHEQIRVELDIPDELPLARCRPQEIQQVLMNLITNARDALNAGREDDDGERLLRVESRVVEGDGRQWLRTTVADDGPGISDEIQERMFDPFFSTKEEEKASGLGLSVSYGIVKDHGGRLLVESKRGQGSQFHVDLPLGPPG